MLKNSSKGILNYADKDYVRQAQGKPDMTRRHKMKLQINNSRYVASNVTLKLSSDLTKVEAFSYYWWKFVAIDKVGNIVFNNTTYSNSTSKHQADVKGVLQRLGLDVKIWLEYTRASINDIKESINSEIHGINNAIEALWEKINTKGSRKAKNRERQSLITSLQYRIKDLRRYADEYIDQKLILTKKHICKSDSYKKYFLKPNSVLKANEFRAFMQQLQHDSDAPKTINALKALLDLKMLENILPILHYEFADNLEQQLPAIDTDEYEQLKTWLNTNDINKNTLNSFALDKIHQYLTNKANKKAHISTPREVALFPIHPVLEALKGIKGVSLITTATELRIEGRKQEHCIGGKQYVDCCLRGHQVLNYKGYTFFLRPDLTLEQTKGKYNSITPIGLIEELKELILAENHKNLAA